MSTTPTQEAFTRSRSDRGIVHVSTYICTVILIWTFAHRNDLRSEWCIINIWRTLILKSIQVKSSAVVYIWNTCSLSDLISNDDFIKIRKQKCADGSAGESRHPVHSLPNNKTRPPPRTVYKLIYYTSPAIIQTAPWDRDRKCRQLYNLFLIWLYWGSSTASWTVWRRSASNPTNPTSLYAQIRRGLISWMNLFSSILSFLECKSDVLGHIHAEMCWLRRTTV